jgi:hypothetical protein
MRISNFEAKERAVGLAASFLKSQPSRPKWEWKVVDASPDLFAYGARDRKTVICWAVVVEWSKEGNSSDGPAVLRVNIETNQVSWLDNVQR